VKPAPFEYFDPTALPDALRLLDEHAEEGKVLAGGQSLLPLLYLRLASPRYLIDVNRVEGLAGIRVDSERLRIGALTRQRTVERDATVRERWPLVTEAIGQIGHRQIRNRGTFGGSVAHADPSGELPAVVAALDGTMRAASVDGEREIAADEFFLTYLTTALQPNELLVEVELPAQPARSGWAYSEISRRQGDFALVGLACLLALEPDGQHIADARLCFTGVGGTPLRARDAEDALRGELPSAALYGRAGELAQAAADPDGDIHGSAEYRRHLMGVVARRALALAHERAVALGTGIGACRPIGGAPNTA
jgi:CO/xanthine dehydrogenase FAD-binding subunit